MKAFRSIKETLRRLFSSSPASAPPLRMRTVNVTRDTLLASSLEVADTSSSRNQGLLGRNSLVPGEGLWIVPCQSVHTLFMRFPIDLVYIDSKKRVKKVRSSVGPGRISICLTAKSVLELPAGTIERTQTRPGDSLVIEPYVSV